MACGEIDELALGAGCNCGAVPVEDVGDDEARSLARPGGTNDENACLRLGHERSAPMIAEQEDTSPTRTPAQRAHVDSSRPTCRAHDPTARREKLSEPTACHPCNLQSCTEAERGRAAGDHRDTHPESPRDDGRLGRDQHPPLQWPAPRSDATKEAAEVDATHRGSARMTAGDPGGRSQDEPWNDPD